MDSQVYDLSIEGIKEESLPSMKYTIQVITKRKNLECFSDKLTKFIESINEGDIILLEYPPIIRGKCTGGIYTFSVRVTNLTTEKSMNIRAGNIEIEFWNNLEKIRVIE